MNKLRKENFCTYSTVVR